jgi:phage shock protein A
MTMTEIDAIVRKTNRTFMLVSANFAMLALLFLGLGFVVLQAATLVTGLKQNLARAEQQVAEMQERLQGLDTEVAMENAMTRAVQVLREEIAAATPDSEALARLAGVPEKVDTAAEAIRAVSEKVQELDFDQVARRVAYHMLKGMGEGFDEAAELRKPDGL